LANPLKTQVYLTFYNNFNQSSYNCDTVCEFRVTQISVERGQIIDFATVSM